MAGYTIDSLPAGAEELRRLAIQLWKRERAIPDTPDVVLSGVQRQDVTAIESYCSGVPAMFEPFTRMPRPDAFGALVPHFFAIVGQLRIHQGEVSTDNEVTGANLELSAVATAGDYLTDWTGHAAELFKREYLDKLDGELGNQSDVWLLTGRVMQQEQQLWEHARQDAATVLNTAVNAMVYAGAAGHGSTGPLTAALTCIASLATILAPAAGPIIKGSEFVLAWADGVASAMPPLFPGAEAGVRPGPGSLTAAEAPRQFSIGGGTAQAVLSSTGDALQTLADLIVEQESRIAGAIACAAQVVGDNRRIFVPKRPLLADAPAGRVTSDEYVGGLETGSWPGRS
jgi:hypothetical protein